jgi:hypothetical protein
MIDTIAIGVFCFIFGASAGVVSLGAYLTKRDKKRDSKKGEQSDGS